MKRVTLIWVLFFTGVLVAKPATIQYSTYLTDANGAPRSLSNKTVNFRLYADSAASGAFWQDNFSVTTANGFVSVALGSKTALPARAIDTASTLWLEMQISGETAFPRQKIATSFYCISANLADSARHAVNADSAGKARHSVKSDSLSGKVAEDFALAGHVHPAIENVDSAKWAAKADSTNFAAKAGALTVVPTRIDTASIATKAMGLIAGITSDGALTVAGQVAADGYAYRTATRRKLLVDGMAGPTKAQIWYATTMFDMLITSNCYRPATQTDTLITAQIPFYPKKGSILKKICAVVSDPNGSATPNIEVCITRKYSPQSSTGYGLYIMKSDNGAIGVTTAIMTGTGEQYLSKDLNFAFDPEVNSYFVTVAFGPHTPGAGNYWFNYAILEIDEYGP
jgi:hypothetical protein